MIHLLILMTVVAITLPQIRPAYEAYEERRRHQAFEEFFRLAQVRALNIRAGSTSLRRIEPAKCTGCTLSPKDDVQD